MKPVVSTLRKLGIRSILYLHSMLIMARIKVEARRHPSHSNGATGGSRLYNQPEKSTFSLTQELESLSFFLNSHNITTSLPIHKLHTLKMVRWMSKQRHTTLRELASLLWMMVVAHPASLPAPFHYRHLVSAKSKALQSGHTYKAVQERTHNINY